MALAKNEAADVQVLGPEHAAAFRALRLRALREEPVPFLASYEEEANVTVADIAARLGRAIAGTAILGAFRADALIGTIGFYRHTLNKACHRASLWGMYVAPEERRRGIAKALLDEAIARLSAVDDLRQIELTVVRTEDPARRLYAAAGFEVQGTLWQAMRVNERYFDEDLMILRLS